MKSKIIVIGGLVLLFGVAIFLNEWAHNRLQMCFNDDVSCVLDRVKMYKEEQATATRIREEQIQKITEDTNKHNAELEAKVQEELERLPAGVVTRMIESNDLSHVPKGLIERLVPQASAHTETVVQNVAVAQTDRTNKNVVAQPNALAPTQPSETFQKIKLYLTKKNAPYKDIDFASIARKTGVTAEQAVTLIAITGQESSYGHSFSRTEGKKRFSASAEEGRSYHNYAGVKWCVATEGCPAATAIPDGRGFWLQKYDSDEQFFTTFFAQMKKGYFDKSCSTASCIKTWYVGDVLAKKIVWANAVNRFVDDIQDTKVY